MSGIYLSEEELDLLAECSLEAMRLYVLGLRTCMHINTGTVGRFSRVSLNGLSDKIRFQPKNGSPRKPFAPSHRQVRTLIDELTSASLCESASTPKEKTNRVLVLRLARAKTSELASFCPETVGQRSVKGRAQSENDNKPLYYQEDSSNIDTEIKPEKTGSVGHITEIQRYKNRDDIYLARENFDAAVNDNSDPDTPQNLAPFSRLLKTEGWRDAQILAQISTLKTLAAEGMTVADLRLGCAIARDNNASSVAYALKCAATSIRKRQHADTAQTATAPRQHAKATTAGQRKAPQGGKFDPAAYINRNRSTINSQHHSQGGACYDHDQQTHLLA